RRTTNRLDFAATCWKLSCTGLRGGTASTLRRTQLISEAKVGFRYRRLRHASQGGTHIESLQQEHSAPGVKQLARCCADVVRLIDHRPGAADQPGAVPDPKDLVKTTKTPALGGAEWRKLLDSIPATTLRNQRA